MECISTERMNNLLFLVFPAGCKATFRLILITQQQHIIKPLVAIPKGGGGGWVGEGGWGGGVGGGWHCY